MREGAGLMVEKIGASIGETALMGAANPAALLGSVERGRLQPGARADILVLNNAFELKTVFLAGRELN